MKNGLVCRELLLPLVILTLFTAGCVNGFRNPFRRIENETAKKIMLDDIKEEAKGAAWALSESNRLFATFMVFAVIGGVIGGVTRMKFGWIMCICCGLGALAVPLISIFAAAMIKYLWIIGILVVAAVVLGLGFLVLKMYLVAKESFAYGEMLKKEVPNGNLEKVNAIAKAIQPQFVKDTIRFLREK